jgi:predicted tellurium resistance membrane protein TerC
METVGLARRRGRAVLSARLHLAATDQAHGQRFVVRERGRPRATPLLLALVVVEVTDIVFAIDSIPAVLAITAAWPASR